MTQSDLSVESNGDAPVATTATEDTLENVKEDEKQKTLRKQLLLIQKDTSLTPQQKALQMQKVMSNQQSKNSDDHRHGGHHRSLSSPEHHSASSLSAGSAGLQKRKSLSRVFNSALTLANTIFHKDGSAVPLSPRGTSLEAHQPSATQTGANAAHADTYNAKTQTITLKDNIVVPYSSETLQKSFTKKGKVLGCEHYARNCKVFAPCCQKWYPCRVCHDEENPDHALQRSDFFFCYSL